MSGLVVREADLGKDRDVLVGLLNENLPLLRHERRFDWLYRDNPCGPARAWLALDATTEVGIGVATVAPRAVWLRDRSTLCGQVVDFAVKAGFRTLGPALLLQKATLQPVTEGALAFCYDTPPGERGMTPFARMGVPVTARGLRFAKALRVDRKVARLVKARSVAPGLNALGNGVLRLRDRLRGRAHATCEVAVHRALFGDEFSRLDRVVDAQCAIRTQRTAAYLNWRYRQDPLHEHETVTARRAGELEAYAVLRIQGDDAYVMDLLGHEPAMEDVLAYGVERLRQRRVVSVHTTAMETSQLVRVLRRVGFSRRGDSHAVVACVRPDSDVAQTVASSASWFLTYGDIGL